MARRRILFVSQQLPWPKDSGGNIRTYYTLAALAREFDVLLCSTEDGSGEGRSALEALGARLRLVPDTKRRSGSGQALGVLRSFFSGEPAVVAHNENPALRAAVREELARGAFDSLHLNHLDTALYFDLALHVDPEGAPPSLIDTHNLLFDYYARRAEVEGSVLRRWVCRREARLLEGYELDVFRRVSRVVVCSEDERARLHAADPALDAAVVPNGVDCEELRPAEAAPDPANRDLVFVGDLAYGPNSDAALRFAREVLPAIRREEPTARFLAVGKNPPPELEALGREREEVVVPGFVEDVREWVWPAAVYVVPIRYGSGTRLKVLEAFALGKATVSTRIGAEGIATADGEDVLLRDEPADMAAAVVELLRDPERRERLGRAARLKVEERYDWPRIGEGLVELHRGLVRDDP